MHDFDYDYDYVYVSILTLLLPPLASFYWCALEDSHITPPAHDAQQPP